MFDNFITHFFPKKGLSLSANIKVLSCLSRAYNQPYQISQEVWSSGFAEDALQDMLPQDFDRILWTVSQDPAIQQVASTLMLPEEWYPA